MMTWKRSDKLRKTKLKFKTEHEIKEYADDLHKLHELEIIDYKIVNEMGFTVTFTKKFVDYYNLHHDRLKVNSINNMIGVIQKFPEDFTWGQKPSPDQFTTMFYSTLIISYLKDTRLIERMDTRDMNTIGRLIVTVEHLRDMMADDENSKRNEFS